MRRSENNKKLYKVERSGLKIVTRMILFLSFVIIFAALIGKGGSEGGIAITPSVTPSPTPLSAHFDETPDSRQVTITQSTWYAIQLAAFENKEAADDLAQSYQARGAAGYVINSANRYRVLAAVYPKKEDAQAVRSQLKDSHGIDSYVYEMVIPELTLNISGMKGQVDVIEASLQFLKDSLLELQKISIALDQKEANQQDVANNIKTLAQRAKELYGFFGFRFTSPKHLMAQKIEALLTMYTALDNSSILQESGSVTLAATLKKLTLTMIENTQKEFEAIME